MKNTTISPAIVMRIKELGETDLLVDFITPDNGRLKGVAKGARKSRRRFANCLDLFCLADLEYEINGKRDLRLIHSGKLVHAFPGLRSDFVLLSLASYLIELTEVLFPPGVADKDMFELLRGAFFRIDKEGSNDLFRIAFEARAMTLGGYGIHFDTCCNCRRPYTGQGRAVFVPGKGAISCLGCMQESKLAPGMEPHSVKGLKALQSGREERNGEPHLSEQSIREIKPVLKLHIEYRIGRRLKSSKYLE